MDSNKIISNWINAFAKDVPKKNLDERVFADGNLLWHIFSWDFVPCLCGNDARKAFDTLQYDKAIIFHSGYSCNGKTIVEDVSTTAKISAEELESFNDVYVTDVDYDWTYVHTHEEQCGPYFCRRRV